MPKDTRPLSDAEQIAWRSVLYGTAHLWDVVNHDMVMSTGLTINEYEILVRLSETHNRRIRMSELAEELVHSRSRLSHTVRRMETQGWVERLACDNDRRGVFCALTASGEERLRDASPSYVAAVRKHVLNVLPEEDIATLGRICRTLAIGSVQFSHF